MPAELKKLLPNNPSADFGLLQTPIPVEQFPGEMTEWPIVQHWKCCVPSRVPGVRIPLSPLLEKPISHTVGLWVFLFLDGSSLLGQVPHLTVYANRKQKS
jgi:hypothetical protein